MTCFKPHLQQVYTSVEHQILNRTFRMNEISVSPIISHFQGAFLHNIGGLWGPRRGLDLHVTKTLDRFIK